MLLHRKLSVIILAVVVFTIGGVYVSSSVIIKSYIAKNKQQYEQALIASIAKDIETFEQILASVEQRWDAELSSTLPLISARIANAPKQDSESMQALLYELRDQYQFSNLYLINNKLTIVAATLEEEIGLDMSSFSQDYTNLLTTLLNQGSVQTHRVSHATGTGILKKYGYFSAPGSNVILNADINVKDRLRSENDDKLSRFLFGDYVTNLEKKYAMIKSIDLLLISKQDAFSLFFEGRKVDKALASLFYSKEIAKRSTETVLYMPVVLESYESLGFKTILKIEFDPSPFKKIQSDFIIQLITISIVMILLAYIILGMFIRKFVLSRFVDLLAQINKKQFGDDNNIQVRGNDEISQIGNAINTLMQKFEQQLAKNKQLLVLSNTDSLTALSNRRHFDEQMQIEWAHAQREQTNVTIIMLDIDNFKEFNDTYGHEQGDECLRQVAGIIKQQLNRPRDFVARYGGEEFLCLLPETGETGAQLAVTRIREALHALAIEHKASAVASYVTASYGCLTVNGHHDGNIRALLQRVDELLYQAKNSGRNKVCYDHIK